MAYTVKTFNLINSREHYLGWKGNYGAAGEKRAKRKKATPDQIKKQNQINRENHVRRTIKANFFPNDLWVCLKYPKGTRKEVEAVKKDFKKFIIAMRKEYKKRNEEFKYIYRLEVGKRGGIHIHILINRIWSTDLLVQKCWGPYCHFTNLYEQGDYRQLASYIVKPLPAESKQLSFFDTKEIKQMTSYSCSRNLIHPEPEKKDYKRRTVKKLITEGPKAAPGYYIDKNSIRVGVNEHTGYSYMYYTEIRVKQLKRQIKPPKELIDT